MNDWQQGTTYDPQGAFLRRRLDGSAAGLTPGGQQGAFSALGAGLKGAGLAQMAGANRSPAEMGLMGLANGAQQAQTAPQQGGAGGSALQRLLASGLFGLGPMAMASGDRKGLAGGLFGGAFMGGGGG